MKQAFTTSNSLIVLVDHQVMTLEWVKSLPKETVVAGCRVLARMAVAYDMPLILTTTMEDYVGPTIPQIQEVAPTAFVNRFKRGGSLDCWSDENLRAYATASGRTHLILAGLTTDICLYWAAVSALEMNFKVMAVADACGTMTSLGDQLTYERLRSQGAIVTVVNQVVTELQNDFGTDQGRIAQQIMADEIISKL